MLAACFVAGSAACSGATPGATGTAGTAVGSAEPGTIAWKIGESPRGVADAASTTGLLIAVGRASTSVDGEVAGAWTSPDGLAWEPAAVREPSGTMTAVAAGPHGLVAVGTMFAGTSGPAVWTSADGREWQRLPASAFAASPGREPGALRDVAYGSRGFVAVGSEVGAGGSRAGAWHSADGLTWTPTPSSLGGDSAGSVIAFGTGFVAAGWAPGADGDDRALFWTSADGLTWAAAPDTRDLHGLVSPVLASNGQVLVAVTGASHAFAASEAAVLTSRDGASWQRHASSGLQAPPVPTASSAASASPGIAALFLGGLVGADTSFVAAGGSRVLAPASEAGGPVVGRKVVWTSSTGAAWTIAADLPAAGDAAGEEGLVGTVAVHRGRVVVFGRPQGPAAPLWTVDLAALLRQGR